MNVGDIIDISGTNYKVTNIQTVTNPDGSTSLVVSYSPA